MTRKVGIAGIVAVCLALALVLWQRSPSEAVEESTTLQSEVTPQADSALAIDPQKKPIPPLASDISKPRSDKREALKEKLNLAKTKREAEAKRPTSSSSNHRGKSELQEPSSDLNLTNKTGSDTEWDRNQIAVLNQLLGECYDIAKEQQPDLAGTVGLQFTLRGEPEIGGLVEEIEFVEEHSSISDLQMRECMQESLYALELDPPDEGIQVQRMVTMKFSDQP